MRYESIYFITEVLLTRRCKWLLIQYCTNSRDFYLKKPLSRFKMHHHPLRWASTQQNGQKSFLNLYLPNTYTFHATLCFQFSQNPECGVIDISWNCRCMKIWILLQRRVSTNCDEAKLVWRLSNPLTMIQVTFSHGPSRESRALGMTSTHPPPPPPDTPIAAMPPPPRRHRSSQFSAR